MPNPSNIERDVPYFTAEQIQAEIAKKAVVAFDQAEKLAKENAPVGGGYVGLTRKQGSDNWEFALATHRSTYADDWWNKQDGPARVFWVKANGVTFIRLAK